MELHVRTVVLDTETTGISVKLGHKIVEIGCVEVIDRVKTDNVFHTYINPERNIPSHSTRIHGITNEQVADKPKFAEIAHDFLKFIKDSTIVIHNAAFDTSFLNFELTNICNDQIPQEKVVDTVQIARRKFPNSSVSLDELCKRFNISLERRKYHGALLDAELLAQVYLELTKANQSVMLFAEHYNNDSRRVILKTREHKALDEELRRHKSVLKEIKNPLWNRVKNV